MNIHQKIKQELPNSIVTVTPMSIVIESRFTTMEIRDVRLSDEVLAAQAIALHKAFVSEESDKINPPQIPCKQCLKNPMQISGLCVSCYGKTYGTVEV